MENEQHNNSNPFLIKLNIQNSQYEEVEVQITDPNRTITEQIKRIVDAFQLQKMDSSGNPIEYFLGQSKEQNSEPKILDFFDNEGREQTLLDCGVKSGDMLVLVINAIPG